MKKPPDPGGSSCYSHSSCFSLVCYCSSAPISQKHGERDGASTDSSSSSDSDLEAQAAPDSEAESYPQPNPEAASDVDEIDVDFGAIVSVKVELKGGKTPSILLSNLLSFAASRIRVSPELPQQSYSNGPQVSISFSEYLVCLLSFELARFCPCICRLRFMSLLTPFRFLDIQLTTKCLIIMHDLACLGLLCTSFLFVKALLKVCNQFSLRVFTGSLRTAAEPWS